MVPAKQGFGADDLAGDEAHLRLEGEHELAALDRLGQRLLGLDLALVLGGEIVVEQAMRPPPLDLARYMAMSAARISDSMLDPWSGEIATPIEAPMSTLCEHSSNGSEIASTTRRAIRSISSERGDLGEEHGELVAGEAREQRARARIAGELGVDDHPQAVGDHDQQLVAAGVAKAVVDHLEAVEIDEQHRRVWPAGRFAEQFVGFRPEMEAIGERGHRIVHAERMGVFDRRAHFGEQAVDGGGKLGHAKCGRPPAQGKRGRRPRPRAAGRQARKGRGRFRCSAAPRRRS